MLLGSTFYYTHTDRKREYLAQICVVNLIFKKRKRENTEHFYKNVYMTASTLIMI